MKELKDDIFYEILNKRYDELLLDYVVLSCEEDNRGKETHKKAVIKAFSILNERTRVGNNLKHPKFYVNENKMNCAQCNVKDFFYDEDSSYKDGLREMPSYMTYWWAFFEPPYGIPYTKEDFRKINSILFPIQFRNDLEIYRWNDDFSNYFNDGKEWWGNALWSVYDPWLRRFVIIGASLTD